MVRNAQALQAVVFSLAVKVMGPFTASNEPTTTGDVAGDADRATPPALFYRSDPMILDDVVDSSLKVCMVRHATRVVCTVRVVRGAEAPRATVSRSLRRLRTAIGSKEPSVWVCREA